MDKLIGNKIYNLLKLIFIVVSAIYIVYATVTLRGLFMDGAYYILEQLNNFSDNIYFLSFDIAHPRFAILFLMQLPLWICNFMHIQNKTVLMLVYNFTLFFLPLLVLFWDYKLSQRTKKIDIFFWHLFVYCLCLIIFSIYPIVESFVGAGMHFILWNYLVSDIDYKKKDIFAILILISCMCATFEYVVVLGLIFFLMHFKYNSDTLSLKNRLIKSIIGYGGLIASIMTLLVMINASGEAGEILRFLHNATEFWCDSLNFCLGYSLLTFALLIAFSFRKQDLSYSAVIALTIPYVIFSVWLFSDYRMSLIPINEVNARTIVCFVLPLIFLWLFFKEYFLKHDENINYTNLICIVLLCGIFQSLWQNVNTYYWDKNIKYMKQELKNANEALYIPSQHPEISGLRNDMLRRYIWHSTYTATSILFSDSYEQKTLLLNNDNFEELGDIVYMHAVFILKDNPKKLLVPFSAIIDVKNRYWDLTKCAKALDEYNKEHNIPTQDKSN